MSDQTAVLAIQGSGHTITDSAAWPVLRTVPATLRVQLRISNISLRTAQQLRAGQVIHSVQPETMDVPMCLGGVQICWCEFAAADERMAIRITQLA